MSTTDTQVVPLPNIIEDETLSDPSSLFQKPDVTLLASTSFKSDISIPDKIAKELVGLSCTDCSIYQVRIHEIEIN